MRRIVVLMLAVMLCARPAQVRAEEPKQSLSLDAVGDQGPSDAWDLDAPDDAVWHEPARVQRMHDELRLLSFESLARDRSMAGLELKTLPADQPIDLEHWWPALWRPPHERLTAPDASPDS